ncbi:MAG: hypothetical protein ACMG6H_14620, partial [Acidobacteriota bacterium]
NRVQGFMHTRIRWKPRAALQIALLAALGLSIAAVARGQVSPAIGPDSYRSDAKQLGVGILTGMVKTTVEKVVNDTNAELSRQGKSIRVQMLPFKFWSPSRFATQYTNRPNEWFVRLPTMIGINVDIPVVADRQIYYPLDLNLTCKGWQTGNGVVKVTAQPGPPSVEGGSIVEDVIHIRDYIDSKVKSYLPQIAAVTQTIPNSQCVTIGASPSNGTSDPFAFVAWDPPGRRPIGETVALPRLDVTFTRLKRLRARGNGASLYNPIENIRLDVYANFNERQSSVLTMKEDDDVALNIPTIVFNNPLPNSLVIIANVDQEPLGSTQDSAFAAALKSANYSPGTHTIQVPKHYVMRVPGSLKPIITTTPAYELTYNVNYVSPTLRQ